MIASQVMNQGSLIDQSAAISMIAAIMNRDSK